MRLLIQRVKNASVTIDGNLKSRIGQGMLVLVGIEDRDTDSDIEWLGNKLVNLRIFNDEDGVMNRSILDCDATMHPGILIVSQFTLMASTKKGNRPSYIRASRPEFAVPMYEKFIAKVQSLFPGDVQTGTFGADMQVELVNDGPVTIFIDSQARE
ncbi:MAG: D-aminoacyl-tRNA deacylase [Bacteroidales bacterium]|nr:D-aminoacyl-tRNA deacylase [Bacteroidales bacterium]